MTRATLAGIRAPRFRVAEHCRHWRRPDVAEAARVATRAGPQKTPQRVTALLANTCRRARIAGAAADLSSGISVTSASVVSSSEAIDAAFSSATRSTVVVE